MRLHSEIEHLLKITLAVYKVTAIFPVGEKLGPEIRQSAYKILCEENAPSNINEILGLFDLAEKKSWINPKNFSVLRREYEKITNGGKAVPCLPAGRDNLNNHRQEKIMEAINGNGRIKIGELVSLFPGVNRRTVLRDLDKLCQTGIMVRSGSGRGVYYVKNGHSNVTMS